MPTKSKRPQSNLRLNGTNVTGIAVGEGWRNSYRIIASDALLALLGYQDGTPNWRLRRLLAEGANAERDIPITPVHQYKLFGEYHTRRFRFEDEIAGEFPVFHVKTVQHYPAPGGKTVGVRFLYVCIATDLIASVEDAATTLPKAA